MTSVPLATTTTPTAGAVTATRLAPKPACVTLSRASVTARSVPPCLRGVPFSLALSPALAGSGWCARRLRAGQGECLSCSQPAPWGGGFRAPWKALISSSFLALKVHSLTLGLSREEMAGVSPALCQSLLQVELSALLAPGSIAAE